MEEPRLLNKRYQLLEPLGKGGMAVVYRARDLMLERLVAVKVLREDYSGDPAFQERFRQEAKAAANLSHPNIVTMHDFGLDNGQLFMVMEYVPGTDLKTLIKQRGRFSPEEALPLLIQACAGIGYAHRAGLVHCDVKPQNMLVTPDMRLKVADFGIARALSTIHPDEQSDVVWGSPQYFAPEQASGAAPAPASDVYSLGIIMYEMLTGSLPFQATTAVDLARLHVEEEPPLLSEMIPEISPDAGTDPGESAFQGTFPALPDCRPTGPRPVELWQCQVCSGTGPDPRSSSRSRPCTCTSEKTDPPAPAQRDRLGVGRPGIGGPGGCAGTDPVLDVDLLRV